MVVSLILILVITIFLSVYFNKPTIKKTIVMSESRVIKQFNRLLKTITSDNISVVKEKLLETLADYRDIKKQQFVEDRTLLTEARESITTQISAILREIRNKRDYIHVNKSNLSEYEGARLCYELTLFENTLKKLNSSNTELTNKLSKLDAKIAQFDSDLSLRKAQIIAMIVDSISINNKSHIDLRLDSLEKSFKHEVNLIDNEKVVSEKMGEKAEQEEIFDIEKYKEIFKNF